MKSESVTIVGGAKAAIAPEADEDDEAAT
jgi:hypothetical protein